MIAHYAPTITLGSILFSFWFIPTVISTLLSLRGEPDDEFDAETHAAFIEWLKK